MAAFGYTASSSSHAYSTIRHRVIMLLYSTPQPVIQNILKILNIHSPMRRNHSLLQYTRDNDTQVSELGPSWPFCYFILGDYGKQVYILFQKITVNTFLF